MTDLTELLERVKAATGPDREIDRLLFMHERGFTRIEQEHDSAGPRFYAWTGEKYGGEITSQPRPEYTSSIDAALALTERVLPDANYIGLESEQGQWCGYVSRNEVKDGHWFKEGYAPTAPLAILAATLSALIAQEPT